MSTNTQLQYRVLAAASSPTVAAYRAAYDTRDHLVVPVIAVVGDIVWEPRGSEGPEHVPASTLSHLAMQWDGRPVVLQHPPADIPTANRRDVLEASGLGQIFNTRYENGALQMDVWFDVAKCERVGAGDIIRKSEAGEVINVSIGAYVEIDRTPGISPTGKRYNAVWTSITADHLAILPDRNGACSIADGCGTMRAADSDQLSEESIMSDTNSIRRRIAAKLAELFPTSIAAQPAGASDTDLRSRLWTALNGDVPAFDWIEAVYPADSKVIYSATPDGKTVLYERSFTVGDDGAVSLSSRKREVVPKTQYVAANELEIAADVEVEVVPASDTDSSSTPPPVADASRAADCGCGNRGSDAHSNANSSAPSPSAEESNMLTNTERARALIGCAATPYTDASLSTLEALSDTQLTALETAFAAATAAGVTVPKVVEVVEQPKPVAAAAQAPAQPTAELPVEQWLRQANAPAAIRNLVSRYQAEEGTRRAGLIADLTANQSEFAEASLNSKSTDELVSLHRIVMRDAAPDYRVLGAVGEFGNPNATAPRNAAAFQPPNSWGVDPNNGTAAKN